MINNAKIIKTLSLIFRFYYNFIFATSIVTLFCIKTYYDSGFETLSSLFYLKIITLAITVYFVRIFKSKELFYYQNLGVSSTFLWTTTLFIDFFIFVITLIITAYLR